MTELFSDTLPYIPIEIIKRKSPKVKKHWIDIEDEKQKKIWDKIEQILDDVLLSITEVLYILDTCLCENANSRRLVYLRKDRHFPSSYAARCVLSCIKETLGLVKTAELIYRNLGIEDSLPENSLEVLQQSDMRSARDSIRKKSTSFKTTNSSQKIENNRTKAEKDFQEQYDEEKLRVKRRRKETNNHVVSEKSSRTATQDKPRKPFTCSRCGESGHRSSSLQCPTKFPLPLKTTKTPQIHNK